MFKTSPRLWLGYVQVMVRLGLPEHSSLNFVHMRGFVKLRSITVRAFAPLCFSARLPTRRALVSVSFNHLVNIKIHRTKFGPAHAREGFLNHFMRRQPHCKRGDR